MKLPALLLLAVATSTCAAQSATSFQATPSRGESSNVGIVDDQALSRAATAAAKAATLTELRKLADRVNQTNCPVVLTSAGLTPYLMLVDASRDPSGNSLDLEFRNTSGKEIRLMELSARILVKRSVYDLDYLPAIHLHLTAYGTKSVDAAFAQLRRLPLPKGIHPTLVEGITLEQVTFADGTTWTSRGNQYCGFSPSGMLQAAR